MDYKTRLKHRLYVGVSYIALGVILILADAVSDINNYFFFAFGAALVVMGVVRLIRYRSVTRDEERFRRQEREERDERVLMMAERARSWAFSLGMMVCGAVVIVLSLLGYHDSALPFAWFVCGQTCLYWVCWCVIRKKY